MSRPNRLVVIVGALCLGWLDGCGDEAASDRFLFQTEHFRYFATEDAPAACDETSLWLERVYGALSGYLGVGLPAGARIDYHLADEQEVAGRCGKGRSGCTEGLRVTSVYPTYEHEIVHAIVQGLGRTPAIFEEGLAVMLGCGYPIGSDVLDALAPIEAMLTSTGFIDEWARRPDVYAIAGSFVRHLVDVLGKESFLRFYGTVSHSADRPTIDAAFEAATGVPLSQLIASWRAATRRLDELCLYPAECAGETSASPRTATLSSSCGPIGYASISEVVIPFDVGSNGRIFLELDGAPPDPLASSAVYRCSGGNVVGYTGGVSDFLLEVPPDRYFFLASWDGAPSTVSLRITEPSAPETSQACTLTGAPLTLRQGRELRVARRWVPPVCAGFPWCPGSALDIVPMDAGRLRPHGIWLSDAGLTGPTDFYLCDAACPADPDSLCVRDSVTNIVPAGTTFKVLDKLVEAGQTLHFATGPNTPDDLYSFGLFLVAP